MKKLSFCLMALALAASTMFTSCGDDDDDDDNNASSAALYIKANRGASQTGDLAANLSWAIGTTVLAKATHASESSDATGITGKLSDILKSSTSRTTIYGYENNEFISITYNGTTSGTYTQSSSSNVNELLIDYLTNGSLKETMQNAFNFDALIIYKNAKDADATSTNFWFSTDCTVVPTQLTIGSIGYYTGTFDATMMNKSKDTFQFTGGSFSCLGL